MIISGLVCGQCAYCLSHFVHVFFPILSHFPFMAQDRTFLFELSVQLRRGCSGCSELRGCREGCDPSVPAEPLPRTRPGLQRAAGSIHGQYSQKPGNANSSHVCPQMNGSRNWYIPKVHSRCHKWQYFLFSDGCVVFHCVYALCLPLQSSVGYFGCVHVLAIHLKPV